MYTSPALRINMATLPAFVSGQPGSAALSATGGTGAYTWSLTGGSLPPGLTLVGNVISGVLALAPGSTLSISPPFVVTVTDAAGATSSVQLALTLVAPPPTITCSGATVTEGEAISGGMSIASAVGGSPPYYFSTGSFAAGAPPFGVIVGLDGNLTGTPADGTGGQSYTFEVCATDLVGASDCCTVTVTVEEGTTTGTYSGTFGGTANFTNTLNACTFSVTFDGSITLPLTVNPDGSVAGTADMSGGWVSTPTGGGNCTSSSGSLSQSMNVSGTSSSMSFSASGSPNASFQGSLSGSTITGTLTLTFIDATGQAAISVTLAAQPLAAQ